MSWISLLLIAIVLLLLYCIYKQPRKDDMPPGPTGLPLIGSICELLWEPAIYYFKRVGDKYGPLVSVQCGLQRVVVINSAEWLHEAFVKQGDMFNHRAHNTVVYFITGGNGIAMAEDQRWRDSRRLTVQVMREFGVGKNSIENFINLQLNSLIDAMQNKTNTPYNIHHDVSTSVLNITWHMLVGEEFSMDDKNLHWIVDSLELASKLVDQGGFLNYTPALQFIGTFMRPVSVKVGLSMVYRMNYFTKLIESHKKTIDDPSKNHDLIYSFLAEQIKLKSQNKDIGTFTDYQMKWLLSDLFIVGLDTTVTTIRWCILFTITRPEVQKKIQQEIDTVIGTERKPSLGDRYSMTYTEAFLNEVLRMSTITPLAVHATPQETTLGKYTIPKQTMVIANLYAMHHDKSVWGDPENFRPERFIDQNGKLCNVDKIVGFSLGRRNCLGESLAKAEMFLFVTNMLQSFNFSAAGEPPSEEADVGILRHPKQYEAIITSRKENYQQTSETT